MKTNQNLIGQHFYTWCEKQEGCDNISGFQTRAKSPAITPEIEKVIKHYCTSYKLPRSLRNLEMRAGKPRAEALRNLVERTGVDDIRSLVGTLIQTDRFGTSVAQALRVHSDSLRTERRQRAEEQAAKTTIKMVPPLVLFVLPSIIFVTIGPAVIELIRQLGPTATGR